VDEGEEACSLITADRINDADFGKCADPAFETVFASNQRGANALEVTPIFASQLASKFDKSYSSNRLDIYVKVNYNTNEQIYLNVGLTLQGACDVAAGDAEFCPSRYQECKPCEIKTLNLFDALGFLAPKKEPAGNGAASTCDFDQLQVSRACTIVEGAAAWQAADLELDECLGAIAEGGLDTAAKRVDCTVKYEALIKALEDEIKSRNCVGTETEGRCAQFADDIKRYTFDKDIARLEVNCARDKGGDACDALADKKAEEEAYLQESIAKRQGVLKAAADLSEADATAAVAEMANAMKDAKTSGTPAEVQAAKDAMVEAMVARTIATAAGGDDNLARQEAAAKAAGHVSRALNDMDTSEFETITAAADVANEPWFTGLPAVGKSLAAKCAPGVRDSAVDAVIEQLADAQAELALLKGSGKTKEELVLKKKTALETAATCPGLQQAFAETLGQAEAARQVQEFKGIHDLAALQKQHTDVVNRLQDDLDALKANASRQATVAPTVAATANAAAGVAAVPEKKSGSLVAIIVVVIVLMLLAAAVVLFVVMQKSKEGNIRSNLERGSTNRGGRSTYNNPGFGGEAGGDFQPGVSNPLYDWYKPHMSRQECSDYLQAQGEGAFVIRDSQATPGWHMLCVKTQNTVVHDKIRLTDDSQYELLPSIGDGSMQPKFPDIPTLVDFYTDRQPGMDYVLALANPLAENSALYAEAPAGGPSVGGVGNPMYAAQMGQGDATYDAGNPTAGYRDVAPSDYGADTAYGDGKGAGAYGDGTTYT